MLTGCHDCCKRAARSILRLTFLRLSHAAAVSRVVTHKGAHQFHSKTLQTGVVDLVPLACLLQDAPDQLVQTCVRRTGGGMPGGLRVRMHSLTLNE